MFITSFFLSVIPSFWPLLLQVLADLGASASDWAVVLGKGGVIHVGVLVRRRPTRPDIQVLVTARQAGAVLAETETSRTHQAFVVGVNKYWLTGALEKCWNDARDMAALLAHKGYAVRLVLDPTRGQLLAALSEFKGVLPGNGTVIVHFAGHGVSTGGCNYLVPSDGDLSNAAGGRAALSS